MKQISCEKVSSDLGLVVQFYLLVILEIWPENSTAFYDENGKTMNLNPLLTPLFNYYNIFF